LFAEEFLIPSDKKKLEEKDEKFAARKRKEKKDLMIKKATKDLKECNKVPEPPSPKLTSAEERLGKIDKKPCSYFLEILQELKKIPSELIDVYELRKRELEECEKAGVTGCWDLREGLAQVILVYQYLYELIDSKTQKRM